MYLLEQQRKNDSDEIAEKVEDDLLEYLKQYQPDDVEIEAEEQQEEEVEEEEEEEPPAPDPVVPPPVVIHEQPPIALHPQTNVYTLL